jgi:ribose/xylose/arabinose/galactoside ABC-type transport system permease subunit
VIALIVILFAGWLLSPQFLTSDNLESITVAGAILIVLAVGQTFVVLTAGIDLSLGSVTMLASVMLGVGVTNHYGIAAGIVMALCAGLLVGIANGVIVAKGKINDFIVTLGMLSVAQGLGLFVSNAQPVIVNDGFMSTFATGGVDLLGLFHLRYLFIVAMAVAIIGHVVLFRTRFGTHLLAVGGNREASRDLGVAVDRVKISAFAISGVLAGLAGVMLTARIGSAAPQAGQDYLLNSVAAAVLGGVSLFGGRGNIVGPVVGAVVLTALLNLMNILGVGVFFQPIVIGTVGILSALLYRYQRS